MGSAVLKKKSGVMGPGPMGLDLIFHKTGVCDVMTYIWTPPKDIRQLYICIFHF